MGIFRNSSQHGSICQLLTDEMDARIHALNMPKQYPSNFEGDKNFGSHNMTVISPNLLLPPGLNGNEALCCRVLMGTKPAASDWSTISHIATHSFPAHQA